MNKTRRRLLGLMVLMAGVAVAYAYWSHRPARLPAGFEVGNGRLEATEVDVASKMPGRLLELVPQEGDTVRKGDVVGRIDVADLVAQHEQALAQVQLAIQGIAEAEAGVANAESALTLAKVTLRRSKEMVAGGFVPDQKLDADVAAQKAAEAGIRAARTRVESARAAVVAAQAAEHRIAALLGDGELKAPISGRVLYRLVEPGEVIGGGGKVLTLIDLGEVYMTVFLSSEKAGQLNVGAEARLLMDAWPGEPIPAYVSFVADKAQFTPRAVETRSEREKLMFRVKVRVQPEWLAANTGRIKPGMAGLAYLRLDASAPWPAQLPR